MPEDFEALRVVDLKEECKKRNLLVGGKKAELIERLQQFEASKGDAQDEEAKDVSEEGVAPRSGAPEEVDVAAEEIVEAGVPPVDNDAGKATDGAMQHEAEPSTGANLKASSKSQPATSAPSVADTQPAEDINASTADKASQDDAQLSGPVASTRKKRQAKADKTSSETPVTKQESKAEQADKLSTAAPVLEAEPPAVKASAAAATTGTDAPLQPAVDAAKTLPDAAPAADQARSLELAQDNAAPTAMDVEPALDASIPVAAATKEADVLHPDAAAAAAEKAVDAQPTAAAGAGAGMASAAAVEDAEMVQYDEASDDEQPVAQLENSQKKTADGKPTKHSSSDRQAGVSTSVAAKNDAAAHGSVRKRGREGDRSAQEDRKAPRTHHKSDVKASQKEKEREREKDKEKEKTQANGNASSERRRKHAPISYKPPERQTSGADRDKTGTDTAKREAVLDKKGSGGVGRAEGASRQGSGLESRQSGPERSVSRTESGHKLSVFERLQRGKGEGAGTPAAPAPKDPLPTPSSTRPADPLPRTTSHSRRNQPTRALKIEGFVRPFTEPAARAMLSETGEIVSMWMPKIKTHAFVIYTAQGQAEATLKATHGLNWPPNNPSSKLMSKFVPVEEAETAIARANGATALTATPAPVANGLAPSRDQSAIQEARLRPGTADIAPQQGRADLEEPRRSRDALDDRRRPREDDRRRVKEDTALQAPEAIPEPVVQEAPPPTLDDLFRKTSTKPCLYWIPLTEEQAAERKLKAEAAAAEKAKAEELPDAPVPMIVA